MFDVLEDLADAHFNKVRLDILAAFLLGALAFYQLHRLWNYANEIAADRTNDLVEVARGVERKAGRQGYARGVAAGITMEQAVARVAKPCGCEESDDAAHHHGEHE